MKKTPEYDIRPISFTQFHILRLRIKLYERDVICSAVFEIK